MKNKIQTIIDGSSSYILTLWRITNDIIMKNVLWITILFLFVLGCSKDDNSSPRLLGTWERSYEPVAAEIEGLNEGDYLIVSQINFSSNNTYTSLLFIIDKNNQEKLGYFSKEIGTYNVDNNMIRLKYNSWASNEENYFESVPLENLILIKSDIESVKIV